MVVNPNGTLPANSPAIGAGTNFSWLFTVDYAGTPRPGSGAWDVGAMQAPLPPANLKIVAP